MKFLALVCISALVISASADINAKAMTDLFSGFTMGLNYPELNPSFHNCSMAMNKSKQYASDVIVASEQENPEAFATAIANFGFNFAQTIRSCGKAMKTARALFDTIGQELNNISQDSLSTRFFTNLVAFNMKFSAMKYAFQNGNFLAAGENLAEIFKLFVFKSLEIPTHRQLGALENVADMVGAPRKLAADFSGVLLGVQGFLEEGNTTIVVDHYTGFVNDTTYFAGRFPALQQAIVSENFSAVITIVTDIYKYIGIVSTGYTQLKGETSAFIQRDLPLFDDETKIAKAVESLFTDLPTTIVNVMRISNAYKSADYREVGRGSGGFYNQLRKGAQK